MYKGAWWVDSPAAVATLEAHGFTIHLIPYLTDAQVDATLAAVPATSYAIVLLTGSTPADSAAQVARLVGRPFFGYVVADEPNCGGTLLTVEAQAGYYQYVKSVDPFKRVFASYHLEPIGVPNPSYIVTQPGLAWNYVMLNYYPVKWGKSDGQAGVDLQQATAAARAFFPPLTPILTIQQAAGCALETPDMPRPLPGLLQTQQNLWAASGLQQVVNAIIYYGWGTNPEDVNLQTSVVLDEATAVV